MNKNKRIEEVRNHFAQLDTDLGMRRMLDLGLETRDIQHFKTILEYVNWHYSSQFNPSLAIEKSASILKDLETNSFLNEEIKPKVLIKTENLHKKYAGGNFQLGPINIELKTREIIGLVGQNGNGKTTLIKSILGDLNIDQGSITYFEDKSLSNSYDLRSQLAYVPQRTETWYGSLMENLQFTAAHHDYAPEENEWYVKMYIARLGLWPYRNHKWKELSGGYKMRFELARTLLRNPKVLLLDEPLANLDIVSQQLILEDLKYLAQSNTQPMGIILSSQQLYEVEKVSNLVLFLNQGKPQLQNLQSNTEKVEENNALIIELETNDERSLIDASLSGSSLERIQFNGGTYLLHFKAGTSFNEILVRIGNSNLKTTYIRNISDSSRRFFFN